MFGKTLKKTVVHLTIGNPYLVVLLGNGISARKQYYLHNFVVGQPDLNFHNTKVQDAILDVAKFWLDKGVDGFRLDVVNMYFHNQNLKDNPPSNDANAVKPYEMQNNINSKNQKENLNFLKRLRKVANSYDEPKILLGEMADDYEKIIDYTQNNDKLHLGYFFELMTKWKGIEQIKQTINKYESELKDGWVCFSLSNHDVIRVCSRWGEELKADDPHQLAPLFMHLLLSLKGTPCIYQGEELGLTQSDVPYESMVDPEGIEFYPGHKGRDGCRTPIVWDNTKINTGFNEGAKTWLPIEKDHLKHAVNVQQNNNSSVLNIAKKILHFRKNNKSLTQGSINVVDFNNDNVLAIKREYEDKILCIFNFSNQKQAINLNKKNYTLLFSPISDSAFIEDDILHLAPFSSANILM